MGILNRFLGNAGEVDHSGISEKFEGLLVEGEEVLGAYTLVRDVLMLTDRRLVFVDKQGITGKKTEFLSVPYRSITRFAVETAGHFDIDAQLQIWVGADAEPLVWDFGSSREAVAAQQLIAARAI